MLYELLLAVTLRTAACDNPRPYTTISTTVDPIIWRSDYGRLIAVPYNCGTYLETTFYRIAEFPDYPACMKRVAVIGEDSHVRGVCRVKRGN